MNEIVVGLINLSILLIMFLTGIELAFCMAIMVSLRLTLSSPITNAFCMVTA